MAAPQFDFVPYPAQVQRLQKSGLEEAQRARTHVLPMPPAYWVVEPGDVGSWSVVPQRLCRQAVSRRQRGRPAPTSIAFSTSPRSIPADYDWDHATDYTGVTIGPTVIPRPAPQGVVDWYAEGTVLYDADGLGRRPAIRIAWDGSLPGVVGVQYEVRLTADLLARHPRPHRSARRRRADHFARADRSRPPTRCAGNICHRRRATCCGRTGSTSPRRTCRRRISRPGSPSRSPR